MTHNVEIRDFMRRPHQWLSKLDQGDKIILLKHTDPMYEMKKHKEPTRRSRTPIEKSAADNETRFSIHNEADG